MLQQRVLHIFITICIVFISGCSPFENSSLIESIGHQISDIFSTKTTVDMNSGGGQTLISVPTVPGNAHEVSVSIGNVYQQNTYATAQGHTVEVMISGTRQ